MYCHEKSIVTSRSSLLLHRLYFAAGVIFLASETCQEISNKMYRCFLFHFVCLFLSLCVFFSWIFHFQISIYIFNNINCFRIANPIYKSMIMQTGLIFWTKQFMHCMHVPCITFNLFTSSNVSHSKK